MKTIIKTLVLATSLFSFAMNAGSQQVAKSFPYPASPDGVIGWLEFKPSDYGTQKHPLIIFLHGMGERGNGTSQINSVAANAIPYYCAHGATMRFTVNSQTSSFVVLSPQLSSQYGYWPPYYVREMVKYAKANLQIDTNRIYITGLSLGGGGTWRILTDVVNWTDYSFDAGIAAAAPVCGTQEENDGYFCNTIAANHVPIWAFHCMDDGTVNVGATQHAEIVAANCGLTPAPLFTYYQSGGHSGAWINAYDTGHISRTVNGGSSFTANPNMYEWFLSKTRAIAPVADAGPSQTIASTSTVVTATGSYSPNGAITAYNWQQVSGPGPATIINAGSPTATISNMLIGSSYTFQLTVTDVIGASGTAMTDITVTSSMLPVQFAYFKGQKTATGNLLQWETATEQNNQYFSIERSSDGNRFSPIDRVTGAGNSNSPKDYSYTDKNPLSGTAYYRLRQVDKDGSAKFSQVILITGEARTAGIQTYPNPVKENLTIAMNNDVKGAGKIVVYEITGRPVAQQTILKTDKLLNAVVNMNSMASGIYLVEVKIGDSYKLTQRVMKQ